MQRHSLKYRLLFNIGLVTCLTALLFGLVSFLFAYDIEDRFFNRLLEDEATRLSHDNTSTPHLPFIQVYPSMNALPRAVLSVLSDEPQRREVGLTDGRHFHFRKLSDGRVLLAEVSDYLVVRQMKSGMLVFLLVCLAIVLAGALWLALFTANRLLRPLSQLTRQVEDLPIKPLVSGFSQHFPHNEVGVLARVLDQQMQRIQCFVQREQQFTRDVSHELRTPLTVFEGALTLLKETPLQPRQLQLVSRLEDNKSSMQQCIAGLLALAREENLQHQNVRLQNALEQALLPYLDALAMDSLSLDVEHNFKISIPPAVLNIILTNLISNAIAHGQGGLNIHLQRATLSIVNQGPEINKALPPNLFATGVKGAQSQGLGMGLSIVKRLCDQYQVAITCRSDNTGTCFELNFSALPTHSENA